MKELDHIKAIEDGMYSSTPKKRMQALEARKAELFAVLAAEPEVAPIELHPSLAELYRRKVSELELALNDDSIKAEASDPLRSLIDKVVLSPAADAPNGLKAERHGESMDQKEMTDIASQDLADDLLRGADDRSIYLWSTRKSAEDLLPGRNLASARVPAWRGALRPPLGSHEMDSGAGKSGSTAA